MAIGLDFLRISNRLLAIRSDPMNPDLRTRRGGACLMSSQHLLNRRLQNCLSNWVWSVQRMGCRHL